MNHDEDDRKDESTGSDCTFPRDVPFEELQRHVPYDQSLEQDAIREYVEIESSGETVLFLEKIKSEKFRDREIDVWNVRTDQNRYWIFTNPTNLYLQESFPSIDFLMSFHIGVIERVMARHTPPVTDEQQQRFSGAWRRWSQATEAFDLADEAEDFQSVGMRCRECLLEFVRSMSDVSMVAEGRSAPKRGDFIHWAELVADEIATGSSASEVRGYLKSVSRSTWQLVGWLTHAKNATRQDSELALDATMNVLSSYGTALVRHERGAPNQCPKCSSYRLSSVYKPDLNVDPPYITYCESCGWHDDRESLIDR